MFIASRIETAFIICRCPTRMRKRGERTGIHQPMQEGGERMCGNASATAHAGRADRCKQFRQISVTLIFLYQL
jgi:hypothetical protein